MILIPDSFKGTLTSQEICETMETVIGKYFPEAQIISIPVADGGEGSVDCFLSAVGGIKKQVQVCGVFGEPVNGYYACLPDGKTAVIEMACCAGLPLAEGRLNPLKSTTYGVGELILAALQDGAAHIILGLGGSATNDGGCGAAAAMGVKFLDSTGKPFIPTGGTLHLVRDIDTDNLSPLLKKAVITAMCDIDNPMFGKNGAAYIFGPQKGADEETVVKLDQGLRHLHTVIQRKYGRDLSDLKGGGAAGAMGAGMHIFLNAELKMGIQTVLDTVKFEEQLKGADLVFTGEGRLDHQSLQGKAVMGIAQRAAALNVPVIAVVGSIGKGIENIYNHGVKAVFSINTSAMAFEESRHYTRENLIITMDNIMRLCSIL